MDRLNLKRGTITSTWGPIHIDASVVQRFREAVGLPVEEAHELVPPTLLFHLCRDKVDVHADVRPHETLDDHLKNPVNGGSVWQWDRRVRAGESVSAVARLKSAALRQGNSGAIAIVQTEVTLLDQAQQTVGRLEQTLIYRDASE